MRYKLFQSCYTLLHHGNEKMLKLDVPKLVVTDCEEGFREMHDIYWYSTSSIRIELDYKLMDADYHLDYRKLFSP